MAKGRKPKGEYSGKSLVFSTRITPQLRKALEKAANTSGRSVSQEVEHRLSRTFKEDADIVDVFGSRQNYRLFRMMADAVHFAGKDGSPVDWLKDPIAFRSGRAAINALLDFVAPTDEVDMSDLDPLLQSLFNATGSLKARQMWANVRSGDIALPLSSGSAEEARKSVAKRDLLDLLDRTLRGVHDERLNKVIEAFEAEAGTVKVEIKSVPKPGK